ncbi:MAG TPA: hypothetical protein VD816_02030, partial [Ohtaekwangia sp.]|nr:hypothetical protein [Ohtaekwangia sp.]
MKEHTMSSVLGKKILMIIVLAGSLLGVVNSSEAQVVDYNKQYFMAKQLFREGKYNLAMESFKPLIPYDQRNQFSAYASFYYALAAYHQGFLAVAKDMLTQVKSVHPTWDKMDDVNYWLGKAHLESKDYFQGMKTLSYIQDKKLQKDADHVKLKALSTITDAETLKRLRDAYPKDETIAKSLVTLLSKDMANPANRAQVEALVKEYNFKR